MHIYPLIYTYTFADSSSLLSHVFARSLIFSHYVLALMLAHTFLSLFILGVSSGWFSRRDSWHGRNQTFVPLGDEYPRLLRTIMNDPRVCAWIQAISKNITLQWRRLDVSVALSSAVSNIYRVHLPWTMSPLRAQIAFYSHASELRYFQRESRFPNLNFFDKKIIILSRILWN